METDSALIIVTSFLVGAMLGGLFTAWYLKTSKRSPRHTHEEQYRPHIAQERRFRTTRSDPTITWVESRHRFSIFRWLQSVRNERAYLTRRVRTTHPVEISNYRSRELRRVRDPYSKMSFIEWVKSLFGRHNRRR